MEPEGVGVKVKLESLVAPTGAAAAPSVIPPPDPKRLAGAAAGAPNERDANGAAVDVVVPNAGAAAPGAPNAGIGAVWLPNALAPNEGVATELPTDAAKGTDGRAEGEGRGGVGVGE